jgi:hypothetical protein
MSDDIKTPLLQNNAELPVNTLIQLGDKTALAPDLASSFAAQTNATAFIKSMHDRGYGVKHMPDEADQDTVGMGGIIKRAKDKHGKIYDKVIDPLPHIKRYDPVETMQRRWMDAVNGFVPGKSYFQDIDYAYRSSGCGGFENQIQTFLYGLDRFNKNTLPLNAELSGLTFITRPRINFSDLNIRQERILSSLDVGKPDSVAFMIRCLLDTVIAGPYEDNTGTKQRLADAVATSPLFNQYNPFMTPVCNALTSITGFPDPILDTFTTEAGFHSEDQTIPTGYDFLRKTYELQLGFKDIQGGIIMAIFYYWLYYIACVVKGTVTAYKQDIDKRRMNFDVSIYRFILDPTRKRIVRWARATSCFPKSVPYGAVFNINEGEHWISAASKFSIPFVANTVEYNDYVILYEFNQLVRRYFPDVDAAPTVPGIAPMNYFGIPFIEATPEGNFMIFKEDPNAGMTLPNNLDIEGQQAEAEAKKKAAEEQARAAHEKAANDYYEAAIVDDPAAGVRVNAETTAALNSQLGFGINTAPAPTPNPESLSLPGTNTTSSLGGPSPIQAPSTSGLPF